MTHKEKLQRLQSITPEREFRTFLLDLLKRSGFRSVQETHQYGAPEFGKDIIALRDHAIDDHEWHAFVVKTGRISGNTNEIETIKNQIAQCFEYPYELTSAESIRINKTKIVTNENITRGAKDSITKSSIVSRSGNISFWDASRLIELIDAYYEDFWSPYSPAIELYCRHIRDSLAVESELKGLKSLTIDRSRLDRLVKLFIEPVISETRIVDERRAAKSVRPTQIKLNAIIDSTDNFIITGEPGTGKSRLVDEIARHFSTPSVVASTRTIPFRLSVSDLRLHKFQIDAILQDRLASVYTDTSDRIDTDTYSPLILIDSIDFMTIDERELLIQSLSHYDEGNEFRFIIAARISDGFNFDDSSLEVRTLHLSNFNIAQAKEFITRYFGESTRGKRFITILQESNLLHRIPTTPLTLSLLSLLYDDNDYEIPATQTDIYEHFTQVLFGRLEVKSAEQLLSLTLKARLLSVVALHMLVNNSKDVSFEMFAEIINGFLDQKGLSFQSRDDLINIINHSGVLYVDHNDRVGFKHASFLEFLASGEIYHHRRREYEHTLIDRFNHPHWQNTAIFYAGRSKDMPDFISSLLERIPGEEAKDLAINIGGLGYLAQALHLTDTRYRIQLVNTALDLSLDLLRNIIDWTRRDKNPYSDMPMHVVVLIVSYWFSFNFRSVTIQEAIREAYDNVVLAENVDDPSDFDTAFKLFLMAATLAHRYIDDCSRLEDLLNQPCFINNPVFIIVGDIFLDYGELSVNFDKRVSEKSIGKRIRQYRKVLVHLTKEPAYRFDEDDS